MSELRDFVADLLERKGAAIEALGPDGLELLAPEPVRKAMGWRTSGSEPSEPMARFPSDSRATGSTGSARSSQTRDAGANGR